MFGAIFNYFRRCCRKKSDTSSLDETINVPLLSNESFDQMNEMTTDSNISIEMRDAGTASGQNIVRTSDNLSTRFDEASLWNNVYAFLSEQDKYNLAIASPNTAFHFKNKNSQLAISFVLEALTKNGKLERPPKLTDLLFEAFYAGLASFSALSGASAFGYGIYLGLEKNRLTSNIVHLARDYFISCQSPSRYIHSSILDSVCQWPGGFADTFRCNQTIFDRDLRDTCANADLQTLSVDSTGLIITGISFTVGGIAFLSLAVKVIIVNLSKFSPHVPDDKNMMLLHNAIEQFIERKQVEIIEIQEKNEVSASSLVASNDSFFAHHEQKMITPIGEYEGLELKTQLN